MNTIEANENLSKLLLAKKEEMKRMRTASDNITLDAVEDEPYEPDFNSRMTIKPLECD